MMVKVVEDDRAVPPPASFQKHAHSLQTQTSPSTVETEGKIRSRLEKSSRRSISTAVLAMTCVVSAACTQP